MAGTYRAKVVYHRLAGRADQHEVQTDHSPPSRTRRKTRVSVELGLIVPGKTSLIIPAASWNNSSDSNGAVYGEAVPTSPRQTNRDKMVEDATGGNVRESAGGRVARRGVGARATRVFFKVRCHANHRDSFRRRYELSHNESHREI